VSSTLECVVATGEVVTSVAAGSPVSNVWSRAKVGHSFPSPRYGHTLVRVPTHGDVADADISLRHAAANSKLLLFGGLNAMYGHQGLQQLLVCRSMRSADPKCAGIVLVTCGR